MVCRIFFPHLKLLHSAGLCFTAQISCCCVSSVQTLFSEFGLEICYNGWSSEVSHSLSLCGVCRALAVLPLPWCGCTPSLGHGASSPRENHHRSGPLTQSLPAPWSVTGGWVEFTADYIIMAPSFSFFDHSRSQLRILAELINKKRSCMHRGTEGDDEFLPQRLNFIRYLQT